MLLTEAVAEQVLIRAPQVDMVDLKEAAEVQQMQRGLGVSPAATVGSLQEVAARRQPLRVLRPEAKDVLAAVAVVEPLGRRPMGYPAKAATATGASSST